MQNRTSTKTGPGRRHVRGHQKASPPSRRGGSGYCVKHPDLTYDRNGTAHNLAKAARRAAIAAAGGLRQFKRAQSAPLRAIRDAS